MLTAEQRNFHMNRLSGIPAQIAADKIEDAKQVLVAGWVESGMALLLNFVENVEVIAQAQKALADHATVDARRKSFDDGIGITDHQGM